MKNSSFLLMLLASVFVSSCTMTKWSAKHFEVAKAQAPFDAIVVPGTPYGETPLNSIFAARILWAKYLYDKGLVKHVIFSGAAVGSPYYEGMAMKIIADSLGIPSDCTFAEIKAEHSVENVWYGWKMAKQLGFKNVALATDPFQTQALRNFTKKRCNNMPTIPIVYRWLPDTRKPDFRFPPVDLSNAFVPDFVPLSSKESFSERFRGTRGQHINFNE
ncbi:MAG: YdcF family protein [Chitinophagales bacterium]